MRIEQSFRDTRNSHLGMGLVMHAAVPPSASRCFDDRTSGQLVAPVDWRKRPTKQLTLRFQSTGRSNRKEISAMTLATRVTQANFAMYLLHQCFSKLLNACEIESKDGVL